MEQKSLNYRYFPSRPCTMVNPHWLELPIFYGPKDVRAIEVRLQLQIKGGIYKMSQRTTKPTITPVWPEKTQISLYIHQVWQGFSFIPLWIALRLRKAHAISEDSDQTADRESLIVEIVVRWLK